MASIRRQLTLWYTAALGVTVLAFGTALYLGRRQSSLRELDQRLELEAELAGNYLRESHRVLGGIVTEGVTPSLLIEVGAYFESARDYVIVVDSAGNLLSANPPLNKLSYSAVVALSDLVQPPPSSLTRGTLLLGTVPGTVRYVSVPVSGVWSTPGAVLVAAPTGSVSFGPGELLRTMLVIAPIIIVGSIGIGYILADTSLRPVEGMMDELDAITDGRSLHRRLAVAQTGDELARLAAVLNGMLARLEESFAGLRRFTADASHELKTPLMVLRVGVERALTNPNTPPEALEALDQCLEQINHMNEMVDNLLTLARGDEGRAALTVADSDLRELMAEAAETAGILGEATGITVRTELPDQPVMVPVDRSRVRQLLLNLVTNAIKYTPAGGKVSLALLDQGAAATLIVGDSGIGIAPADLPHIFDRFFRVDVARARTEVHPGTGLGLAITRWIAEAHGGSIAVQSRPGRGTVFTVTLPRNSESLEPLPTP